MPLTTDRAINEKIRRNFSKINDLKRYVNILQYDSFRIPKLNLALPGELFETELPALIISKTDRVFGFYGSNPSPVPHRLMTTPAAGHPLPKGEGVNDK